MDISLAELADLRYVVEDEPGIRRVKRGRGFSYLRDSAEPVTKEEVERINALVIPPAWTDVWICPDTEGHIQATGRDAAGRKQYRYHPEWEKVRDEVKFNRMALFGESLPDLRRRVEQDLAGRGLGRQRVVALCVAILDQTLIRIGNDRYAAQNGSYGLTTIKAEHADVVQDRVQLSFDGKGGAPQELALRDRRLASLVARCQELKGQRLLSYVDDEGRLVGLRSEDVNEYLRSVMGEDFSAKDFRTWGASATVTACLGPIRPDPATTEEDFLAAVDVTAVALGNTRAVCRSSYVHPDLAGAFSSGALNQAWGSARRSHWMARGERALLRIVDHKATRSSL